jgi:hypothetical protein
VVVGAVALASAEAQRVWCTGGVTNLAYVGPTVVTSGFLKQFQQLIYPGQYDIRLVQRSSYIFDPCYP